MTNEQILEFAREHLEEYPDDFAATREQLIAFALKIHKMGYDKGHDDGWEDRGIAESSTYSSGLVGDPQ